MIVVQWSGLKRVPNNFFKRWRIENHLRWLKVEAAIPRMDPGMHYVI
jgi:hypothetical protein